MPPRGEALVGPARRASCTQSPLHPPPGPGGTSRQTRSAPRAPLESRVLWVLRPITTGGWPDSETSAQLWAWSPAWGQSSGERASCLDQLLRLQAVSLCPGFYLPWITCRLHGPCTPGRRPSVNRGRRPRVPGTALLSVAAPPALLVNPAGQERSGLQATRTGAGPGEGSGGGRWGGRPGAGEAVGGHLATGPPPPVAARVSCGAAGGAPWGLEALQSQEHRARSAGRSSLRVSVSRAPLLIRTVRTKATLVAASTLIACQGPSPKAVMF